MVVCLLGVAVTGNKLYTMAQIRGWVGGAEETRCTVTRKWATRARRRCNESQVYHVALSTPTGDKSTSLDRETWEPLQVGDTLEARFLPGDRQPYLAGGICAIGGNFAFDLGLLLLELGGVVFFGLRFVQARVHRS